MSENRPSIPSATKRAVRQKCKFACVMCGNPICDYEHIIEYSDVHEHEADNLTLLCTMHHRQKTNGILSAEVVRERTNNIQHLRGGMPDINFPECKLILGNNTISTIRGNCFEVKDKDFLRIGFDDEAQQVLINAAFYDRDGNIAFSIKDNIYSANDDSWDVEFIGNRIIFREGPSNIFLTIALDGLQNTITIKGKVFLTPTEYLELNDKGLQCHGYTLLDKCTVKMCDIGLLVAKSAFLMPLGGGFIGGRHHGSSVENCTVGIGITEERITGIFQLCPRGKD